MEGVVVNPEFWSGKRVFLTGHTGFKGGWLAHWLKLMGARVTGYALEPPGNPNLFTAAGIDTDLNHILADLRDAAALRQAVREADPEIIFHLAAQPLVRRSYEIPEESFATNVMGTLNLFEAARGLDNLRALINVTSDKCYENREWCWAYRENEALGGHDPYSASKACAEILTASYRNSFFRDSVPIASARAGNVIGGGDWGEDRLIPDLIRSFTSGQTVHIRRPSAVRPWQHVLDALSGYLCLAERLAGPDGQDYAEAWNFGPDQDGEVSVSDLVQKFGTMWGEGAHYEMAGCVEGPHEATLLKLDSTKARTRLGWRPRWKIGEALQATAEWYRTHADQSGNIGDLMNAQISRHQYGTHTAGA